MLSMADGKIKYPIAEAAKRKTTKVTIALVNCYFGIGWSETSFITLGFIDKDLHNHKDKQNMNDTCAGQDNTALTESAPSHENCKNVPAKRPTVGCIIPVHFRDTSVSSAGS